MDRDIARSYQDLIVWQRGIDLVEAVYLATSGFPSSERYGLASQMQRAAISIPSNVAEGQGRGGGNEFIRFLTIAKGSLRELETQMIIAKRLRFIDDTMYQQVTSLTDEVARLLHGLIRRVHANLERSN